VHPLEDAQGDLAFPPSQLDRTSSGGLSAIVRSPTASGFYALPAKNSTTLSVSAGRSSVICNG
jgi:hypothetical protein